MKKGIWKRRAFAVLVAAAMVLPQGVYAAADTTGNDVPNNTITEEVLETVHDEGCTLAADHEGDCVTDPVDNMEEQPERKHAEGCILSDNHEGACETEEKEEEMPVLKAPQDGRAGEIQHNIGDGDVELDDSCGDRCPGHVVTGSSSTGIVWEQHKIIVNGGKHDIIVRDVTIDPQWPLTRSAMDITNGADVTLVLEGSNILNGRSNHPGIWVDEGTFLTIEGDGSLYAAALAGTAGMGAAGIGSSYGSNTNFGDITINSGTVEAYGTIGGAGIGGGYETGSGTATGNITINGGYVKAVGGHSALDASAGAGIGAGENANYGGTITITGGVVYAQSGKDGMPSIGGGGRIIGGGVNHGTFSTGTNGNAVIVAPDGIGANQNAADWDGILISYGSDADTVKLDNGTVVINDADANVQVWGDPELDYDLTIENGTTLKVHKDDRGVNDAVSLTMKNGNVLTNNGTIRLGSSADEFSYLILEGGVADTRGDGILNWVEPSAVKLPLTEELVTVANDTFTYNGKEQKPKVTVELRDLWRYSHTFLLNDDYTETYEPAESKDAGEYVISLENTNDGNLLAGTVQKNYTIEKADFSVGLPSAWSVQEGETQLLSKLPKPNISIASTIVDDMAELKAGTLEWFTDEDRTTPVTDDCLKDKQAGEKITIYGRYSHEDSNFISPKEGALNITITKYKVPNVNIYEAEHKVTELTRTYGDAAVDLNVKIDLGSGDVEPNSAVTWTSNKPEVASVDGDGVVTFHSAGKATITATVAEYSSPQDPDSSYAQASGRVAVTVNPKEITVDETNLMLNNQAAQADDTYTWMYDGKKDISVDGLALTGVLPEDTEVTVTGLAVLNNVNEGTRKATIIYTLSGTGAENYVLANNTSERTVIITENPDNRVVLSYDANGGTGFMESSRMHKGEIATIAANEFAREGYTFDGWNTRADGNGTPYKAGDKLVINQNTVLYAQWESDGTSGGDDGDSGSSDNRYESNTYWVRYHNDDDTERDGKFIPGEEVAVKSNVFTAPRGKVLAGWSLEEDGRVDYKAGDTFRMPGRAVDLYAVWKDAETESHSAYISGYPDGTVGPDRTITRAEAATMFYNLLADKTGNVKAFTDVPANQWYANAVMTLAGNGIISGYPDGTFKPNAPITRAEFVTMAMNFADADKGTACSFPDVPENMWYYGAIAGATENGWISGYPDGTFGPDRYITRAEVTSVINRMENRAADMSFMMEHLDELRTFSDLDFGHWAYGSMMEAANGHDYTRADKNSYEAWVDTH